VDLFPTWTAVALLLPVEADRVNVRPVDPQSRTNRDLIEVTAVQVPPVQDGKVHPAEKSS
jgi:hypothetical protein